MDSQRAKDELESIRGRLNVQNHWFREHKPLKEIHEMSIEDLEAHTRSKYEDTKGFMESIQASAHIYTHDGYIE